MADSTGRVLSSAPRALLLGLLAGHGMRPQGHYHKGCKCRLCRRARSVYDRAQYLRKRAKD
jgi:hypothetical protein